jgi:hypothetical protein
MYDDKDNIDNENNEIADYVLVEFFYLSLVIGWFLS